MAKKTEKKSAEKLRGKDGFEKYYSDLFGARWENLRNSLFGESVYAEWNAGGVEKYFLDPASVFAACISPTEPPMTVKS